MDSLGILVYLGFIFIPGIGIGELLDLWGDQASFACRLGYAFGLGLSVDTLVLVIKTSGLSPLLTGVNTWVILVIIGIGGGSALVSISMRKCFKFWIRPTRLDYIVLGAMVLQGLMILLYFEKYPIFPGYQTPDYAIHIQDAESLLSGSLTTIPDGILYFGVHLQLAVALLLVGGSPLVTVRWTMAILAVLSPLLFNLVVQTISRDNLAGALTAAIYSLSATIWFGSVFDSGLYANFFGILIALYLVVAFLECSSTKSRRTGWVALFLVVFAAYFSHYTILTVFPALLVYVVLCVAKRDSSAPRGVACGLMLGIPGAAGLLLYPNFESLLSNVNSAGGIINGSTMLSRALAAFPVLGYMALETYDDLEFIVLLALASVFIWKTASRKSPELSVPIVWLLALLVASPLNVSAWRYSLEALVPLTIMAGFGLFSILPKPETRKGRQWSKATKGKGVVIAASVLLLILVGSWGTTVVSDATTGTTVYSEAQYLVNQSITWLGQNTPQNSSYLAVSDWRYSFTSVLIAHTTTYIYTNQPPEALNYSEAHDLGYIIVTNLVPTSVQSAPEDLPWDTFPANSTSTLALVYSNPDVRIYQVV